MPFAFLPSCAPPAFVRVEQTSFTVAGERHCFAGVNFWQGMHLALARQPGDRERLRRELDTLRRLGVTNLRVMASSEGPNSAPYRVTPALMVAPGEYDTDVFDGLDYLIAEAAARNMRCVLVLTNFWEWTGGMAQYVSWSERTPIPYPAENDWHDFARYAARFYTNAECQTWFRDHVRTVVERRNRYTGRDYRDEPAIFAWELANEPRYYPVSWISETADYLKSLDANHLVTTGSEGRIGGPVSATHAGDAIDYLTVHIWPQNWGWYQPNDPASLAPAEAKAVAYFLEHVAAARALGKPLVLEEFGLARDASTSGDIYDPAAATTHRNRFFSAMYDEVQAAASDGGPAGGDNLWVWSGAAQPGDVLVGDPPHEKPGWYSVYSSDVSTLEIIEGHAAAMNAIANSNSHKHRRN